MPANISLLIAAYNRANYVPAAVKSVLAQTRGDFELLVWDDGSTDNTLEVAKQAVRSDPRVRVMRGAHQGLPLSINEAVKQLSGNYFGWIDSDDMLAENALRETAAILDQRPEIGMVYTDYLSIDSGGTVKGLGHRCKIPYSKDRLLIDFMTFHFRLMRRSIFDAVGQMEPSTATAEDYDLCLRISEVTEIHHLQRPLYYYRLHDQAVSQTRRLEQIEASAHAIRRALARRNLGDKFQLNVEYTARFSLRQKR
jgi:glycosyltransferase involved in cell wall biosynthesis